jgi:hypothetical protein
MLQGFLERNETGHTSPDSFETENNKSGTQT